MRGLLFIAIRRFLSHAMPASGRRYAVRATAYRAPRVTARARGCWIVRKISCRTVIVLTLRQHAYPRAMAAKAGHASGDKLSKAWTRELFTIESRRARLRSR